MRKIEIWRGEICLSRSHSKMLAEPVQWTRSSDTWSSSLWLHPILMGWESGDGQGKAGWVIRKFIQLPRSPDKIWVLCCDNSVIKYIRRGFICLISQPLQMRTQRPRDDIGQHIPGMKVTDSLILELSKHSFEALLFLIFPLLTHLQHKEWVSLVFFLESWREIFLTPP